MIEGIQATLTGEQLKVIWLERAGKLRSIAEGYLVSADGLKQHANEIPAPFTRAASYQTFIASARVNNEAANECEFLANHLDLTETYRLTLPDLVKIGVVRAPKE